MISTDTAFLAGALAVIGPRVPRRLRVFLLALAVVDDIGALSIIALVYTENLTPPPLLIATAGLVGVYFTRYLRGGHRPVIECTPPAPGARRVRSGTDLDPILDRAALCATGFTTSLFILDLAIDDALAQNETRVDVLAVSPRTRRP